MESRHLELWRRLEEYQFDAPEAKLTFAARLARENGWSLAYAKRALEEYKRFCYLAVAAGHPVTPSEDVDQVWHLHLVYTRNYWQNFCPNVLQMPLHHGPTKGGAEESVKHDDWYRRTLESYRQHFGTPPADLWPDATTRFEHDIAWRRVNRHDHWIVPKPKRKNLLTGLATSAALLFLAGCAPGNPLDWDGQSFLGLYIPLLIAVLICSLIARKVLAASPASGENATLSLHELAYLQGRKPRLFITIATDLVRRGHFVVEGDQLRAGTPLSPEASSEEREVFDAVAGRGITEAAGNNNLDAQPLHDRLVERGLLVAPSRARSIVLLSSLPMILITCFGIAKIMIGSHRGKPVGFLIVLCVISAFIAMAMMSKPFLSSAGKAEMRTQRRHHISLKDGSANHAEVPLAVAIYGVAALSAGAYMNLQPILKPLPGSGNTMSTSGGGCSGGCGGGDGGGGGCGGCGGGD